jgi:16S rRNA (adenine1518-N6/adenine1519-N6)-dimethyltransferase
MVDEEVLNKIASHVPKSKDILEIGGGHGELSSLIKPNTIIEIDNELADKLRKRRFNVIKGDALKEDLTAEIIVGNISYEIAEPLMNKLVRTKFTEAILCVPKEFAYGLKGRGVLGMIMPLIFKIKVLFDVGKESFDPKPRVNSAVISIKPKKMLKKNKIIKEVYSQSDKKLKNAIREAYCRVQEKSKREVKIPELEFIDKLVCQLNYEEWKVLVEKL